MKKIKTYILTVSRTFPATHKRKGKPTFFVEKIQKALKLKYENVLMEIIKLHTIRSNYELWAKRIAEIQKGNAILSIRYWSGKPYNSKQIEICQLDKDSWIGVQKLSFSYLFGLAQARIDNSIQADYRDTLAKNDGLSLEDFKEWFKKYDLSKPMAIIHFTKFRY